jgi:hypothetical protein
LLEEIHGLDDWHLDELTNTGSVKELDLVVRRLALDSKNCVVQIPWPGVHDKQEKLFVVDVGVMVNICAANQELLLLECYPDVEGCHGDAELSSGDFTISVGVEAPKRRLLE